MMYCHMFLSSSIAHSLLELSDKAVGDLSLSTTMDHAEE
jgi:hypothetical protein